ncbi:hypothetical protein L2E82_29595 [Cichorium intybus]|uniref:Uncharacterized protein n=1 Tax=Cichorium intybus TaxID=13427 RepID=A0ACB9CYD2_CICIN|nr:hypothetical protein L2E82_29595 [Cichorium intybus]
MGRFVVREESHYKPWERSRLWGHESFKVLKQKKGTENVLGLTLDMRMIEKEKLHGSLELKTDALSKMDSLMLLQLNYVQINGPYENFPEQLRWLCMHGFPLESIPSDLLMENLVSLDMSYSNIESFGIPQLRKTEKLIGSCLEDQRLPRSLKILNLGFCERLRSVGGFDQLLALERLIVRNCIGLLKVSESIKQCLKLVHIDLRYCDKLGEFPKIISMIGKLNKVDTLLLEGCNLGESQTGIKDMYLPELVKASNIGMSTMSTVATCMSIPEVMPSDSNFFLFSFPRSLLRLSLANTNLSIESFPIDFESLSMLRELYLDKNPLAFLPNCVRKLPRLEMLSMQDCKMLTSVEHPPQTLTYLNLYSEHKSLIRKLVFDTKMSPLDVHVKGSMLLPSSFEFEGLVKIQPMADVEEKVLHSLAWTKLDFLNARGVRTSSWDGGYVESEIQMYYEFGIFSTIYGGEGIPNWITNRSTWPSITFTVPSSSNNLTGLNFCYVQMQLNAEFKYLPMIEISNITKTRTWIYHHYIDKVFDVAGKCFTFLSHWMFGMNDMEGGDLITITVKENPIHVGNAIKTECGVSFVYADGDTEEEEDVLGYYKSWNHIIGGDLTGFELTTGEYILSKHRLLYDSDSVLRLGYLYGDNTSFKDKRVYFRAFSQRKYSIPEDGRAGTFISHKPFSHDIDTAAARGKGRFGQVYKRRRK